MGKNIKSWFKEIVEILKEKSDSHSILFLSTDNNSNTCDCYCDSRDDGVVDALLTLMCTDERFAHEVLHVCKIYTQTKINKMIKENKN